MNRDDELMKILDWIEGNFSKSPLLPCYLQDMTKRELKIMEIVTHHAGFLKFLQSHIEETVNKNDGQFEFVCCEVEKERLRQIQKGYDRNHDDEHNDGSIVCSNWGALPRLLSASQVGADHKSYGKFLVQSAALIFAELERLKRKNTSVKKFIEV